MLSGIKVTSILFNIIFSINLISGYIAIAIKFMKDK